MKAISIDRPYVLVRIVLYVVIVLALLAATRHAVAATSGCEARAARAHQILLADSLDNWEPVNERTVLIWTRHSRRAHLVRLDRPLNGLTAAAVIELVVGDHGRLIRPCGRDGITILDSPEVGKIARIISIELLSRRRTAELDRDGQAIPVDSFRV